MIDFIKEKIFYPCYRFFNDPFRWVREVYWFCQRIFRGYSDCDLWGLDYHLADLILKRLKAFRYKFKAGVPSCLVVPMDDEDMTKSFQNWHGIIDKMIFTFEYIMAGYGVDDDFIEKYNNYDETQLYSKYTEGFELFVKYFSNLWD